MELHSMVRINRIHPSNRDAQQNQIDREHNLSLRCMPRSLQILLHSQLDLQILL